MPLVSDMRWILSAVYSWWGRVCIRIVFVFHRCNPSVAMIKIKNLLFELRYQGITCLILYP